MNKMLKQYIINIDSIVYNQKNHGLNYITNLSIASKNGEWETALCTS
jgi:hypothetical protein